jgi:hypothetical protein
MGMLRQRLAPGWPFGKPGISPFGGDSIVECKADNSGSSKDLISGEVGRAST